MQVSITIINKGQTTVSEVSSQSEWRALAEAAESIGYTYYSQDVVRDNGTFSMEWFDGTVIKTRRITD